jgi:hypothetical protein
MSGLTGQGIIVAGERDPRKLAELSDPRLSPPHHGKRLIENARLTSKLNGNDSNQLQTSNRERMAIRRRAFSRLSSFEPQDSSLQNP